MSTILEAIEEANDAADIKTFSFANIKEFNAFLESFNFDDYPVNVVVPFTVNGTVTNNRTKDVVPLQGWVITRIETDTVNIRSAKAEKEFLSHMRAKARDFVIAVLNSDITDPEVENVTYSIRPEYAFLSSSLFGVSYTMNWPISEGIC